MPNLLSATGLTVQTEAELDAELTAAFQSIFGSNIVLTSDSPDGQLKSIFKQKVLDLQDLLMQVFTSMDPDQAFGTTLDQRVAINGIQRQAGTFTVTPVTIVTSQSVNLYGLDQTAQPVFTVADGAGNQWQLQTTQLGVAAGSHVYNFQAAQPGAVPTVPNTITVPVTITLGVTSVNNPTSYTTLGINEESDVLLRVRRQKSVSLAGQGWISSLRAALKNISGVTDAFIYENRDPVLTNGDGVPGKSIWVVVAGSGAAAAIAQAIYTKRGSGSGMRGQQSYTITQADGSPFTVFWDNVTARTLFIQFAASSLNGTTPVNLTGIRAGLPTTLVPGVNQAVNANQLGTLVQQLDPNALASSAGFTTGLSQTVTFSPTPASGTFTIGYGALSTASINWNDTAATVQTRLQAVTGLAGALVTGSVAAGLVVDLSQMASGPSALLTCPPTTGTTLLGAGSTPVTPTWNAGFQPVLSPPSKQNQFVLAQANVIISPMQLTVSTPSVAHTGTATFTGVGGYGALLYSFQTNNSGGTINGSTGAYTAGVTGAVVDTVLVRDQYGNFAICAIGVT